jgi:hypothetical protein
MQLGGAPRAVLAKTRIRNIFATANHGFWQRQALQFRAQAERAIEQPRKAARLLALAE